MVAWTLNTRTDQNNLSELAVGGALVRLRVLRVSGNRLQRLSARAFPHVRTLYADNNALPELADARRLARLENLSLRNQSGKGLYVLPYCMLCHSLCLRFEPSLLGRVWFLACPNGLAVPLGQPPSSIRFP